MKLNLATLSAVAVLLAGVFSSQLAQAQSLITPGSALSIAGDVNVSFNPDTFLFLDSANNPAPLGSYGTFRATNSNTGSFAVLNGTSSPNYLIKSLNENTAEPVDRFIRLGPVPGVGTPSGLGVSFTLTDFDFTQLSQGPSTFLLLSGSGFFQVWENGVPDTVALGFLSTQIPFGLPGNYSYSGTIVATEAIPEPSTVLGLFALGTGAVVVRARRKQNAA
jgi:hypothetical protein